MSDRVDLSDPNGDPGRMFSECVLWFTCIPVTWGNLLKKCKILKQVVQVVLRLIRSWNFCHWEK